MRENIIGIAVVLLLAGIILSSISSLSISVEELSGLRMLINSKEGSNRIGVHISGSHNLEALFVGISGNYTYGSSPLLRVFSQREEVVFSFPIDNFTSTQFHVSNTGFYTIVLEDVNVTSTALLEVFEYLPSLQMYYPLSGADIVGIFVKGASLFAFALGVFSLFREPKTNGDMRTRAITEARTDELAKRMTHVSTALIIVYALGCFEMTFLTSYISLASLPSWISLVSDDYALIFSSIMATLGSLYWVFINRILRKMARRMSFKQFVYLHGLTYRLGFFLLITGTILLPLSFLLESLLFETSPIGLDIFLLSFAVFWSSFLLVMYLIPFTDRFSAKDAAILSLKEFKHEYEKNPSDADLALLSHAARHIATLVKPFGMSISPNLLFLGMSSQLLKDSKISDLAILSKALEDFPEHSDKTFSIVEQTVSLAHNLESKGFRVTRSYIGQIPGFVRYIIPLIAAIATIVGLFIK